MFRQKIPQGKSFFKVTDTLSGLGLNTVCEEAKCPNRTDCYGRGTLTFQILGKTCTRRCGFCAESTGVPGKIDIFEPFRIVQAVKELALSHVVITAPARDDLEDGGASIFAQTVELIHEKLAEVTVEVLVSDLMGNKTSLQTILASQPDVFNHNVETVPRLTPKIRAKATYSRSLEMLKTAGSFFDCTLSPCVSLRQSAKVKSGIMVGLGESQEELCQTVSDLRNAGVDYLTVGQYLQPSFKHLPVEKYYSEEEFKQIKSAAEQLGFEKVFVGPLVRSSYHAQEMAANVR